MNQALFGLISIVFVILLSERSGYRWRPAAQRLTLSGGLFCFGVACTGIVTLRNTPEWVNLWSLTGGVVTAVGGFSLLTAVMNFSRTTDPE